MIDITLDEDYGYETHNIQETKTLLTAFVHKLTRTFLTSVGLTWHLREKQISSRGNKIIGAKHG